MSHLWGKGCSLDMLQPLGAALQTDLATLLDTGSEFSTMTPHRFDCRGGPAEIITIFDREGRRAHLGGSVDRAH